MRVLIIGGTRFIGPRVVRPLTEHGHEVAVFHRGECEGELPDSVRHIHGQRDALLEHHEAFAQFAPDVVVHMILGTAQDAWTARLAFEDLVDHFVLVSSMDVYRAYGLLRGTESGPPEPVPIAPRGTLRRCLHPYRYGEVKGIDKAMMTDEQRRRLDDYDKIPVEQILLASEAMQVTVLRLPMVHGPGDPQHRLHGYLKRMDDGREAIVLGAERALWRTTRGYVDDVGLAIAQAALFDPGDSHHIFNVGEADALTEEDFVLALGRAAGWDGRIVIVPDERLPPHLASDYDFRNHLVCDVSETPGHLGLPQPTPVERGLADTVTWARMHPPESVPGESFDYDVEDRILAAADGDVVPAR